MDNERAADPTLNKPEETISLADHKRIAASLQEQLEASVAKYNSMKGYADSLEEDKRTLRQEYDDAAKQCFFNDQQARLYRQITESQQKELEFIMRLYERETGRKPYVVP